jgi:hypothetical protein
MQDCKPFQLLCDGYSTQSKLSNKYWLFVILASIVSLINLDKKGELALPLSLGKVNAVDFNSFILIMICTTTIAFASTFAQSSRTRNLAHRFIESLPIEDRFMNKIHIQDIFDSVTVPNFNRVAPISQFLLGKNQFLGDPPPKKIYKHFGAFIYILLKLISLVIAYIIPLIALYRNFILFTGLHNNTTSWGLPYFFYWFLCILTFGVYVILIVAAFKYMFKVTKRILKNNS